jgi:hypothetical protein
MQQNGGGQNGGRAHRRQNGGKRAPNRRKNRAIPSTAVHPLRCRASFSFSFLLILDEGGLREGWAKSAHSSLATTAWPRNHNNIFFCVKPAADLPPRKTAANRRQISGKTAAPLIGAKNV